ncbi:MAG: Sigma-adaptin 3A [Chaenotheca gracillima]|nr:MAG: Sigma-adaptin 3A [Chaenotheca gracillima]
MYPRSLTTSVSRRALRSLNGGRNSIAAVNLAQRASLRGSPFPTQHYQRASLAPANSRLFSISRPVGKGITPDSEDPPPKDPMVQDHVAVPADITTDEYHELSDQFMDELVSKLEAIQEEKGEIDVEYSAGVLTVAFPPAGTYVLNKQPPNKQIWLSSPTTGPKRYDWVVSGESMHQKEGCGIGDWVYLRDGSTLQDLVKKELGVNLSLESGPS